MTDTTNIKSWLGYWKKTLIDVDRKKIDVSTHPIPVESYYIDKVPEKHARFLWNASSPQSNASHINVDICPCSVRPKFEHGKSKEVQEEVLYPFWIPAIMYKNGNLAPQKQSKKIIAKPIFIREYLSPNPKNYYSISTIDMVDDELRKFDFKDLSWKEYWKECEALFESITGKNFASFNISHESQIFIQKGGLRGVTENIKMLYNELDKTTPADYGLLKNIIQPQVNYTSSPSRESIIRNNKHIGQMSNSFPLSVSQRESIAAFNDLISDNILAVNGPPGTGKTTLLQSIIANSVVSSVVNQEAPQLVIACSANNQAITNILDSFSFESEDELTQRWLPNLKSLGLYLSTTANSKYQTCTSEFGEGFMNSFEQSSFEEKETFFLDKFEDNIGRSETLELCADELYAIVKKKVMLIDDCIATTENYEKAKQTLVQEGFSSAEDISVQMQLLKERISENDTYISKLLQAEEELKEAHKNKTLKDRLLSFTSKSKERKATSFKRILIDFDFEEAPNYNDFEGLIHLISKNIIDRKSTSKDLKNKYSILNKLRNNIEIAISSYEGLIEKWDSLYGAKLTALYSMTKQEYQNLQPLEDMQVRLDLSYRYEAFWYAIHFREAEYLITIQDQGIGKGKARGKISYRNKLQRFAGITPIYISTFHTLPRFGTFYDREEGVKPYFSLFDIMIVDEAGQVAPDISVPSFALAKKAVIVGDIYQIEPVWSVEEMLDIANLKMNGILEENADDEIINSYQNAGLLSSSGSLMRLAQRACFIQDGGNIGGTLLKEHRRCPDKIISYCNQHVYDNKLVLTKGNKRKAKTDLPLKGFLHINSTSEKSGTSRVNRKDAETIAQWIENKRLDLEDSFGNKPIKDILAIVTPYKSQARLIKKELLAINKDVYKGIVSGTVHALQGAEIDIVIFSTVITPGDSTFFANNLNILNVAISRAKSSFLVFGNLDTINPTQNTPLAHLKQWLQEDDNCELSNKIIFDNRLPNNVNSKEIQRINDLSKHVSVLNRALEVAKTELIIVSPFISSNAIECKTIKLDDSHIEIKSIKEQLQDAVQRGVKVLIITDSTLDIRNGTIKPNAKKGREIITASGAELKLVNGIHSKTIIMDDRVIIEGSFNWFSALRDKTSLYYREESSIIVTGQQAPELIKKAKTYLKKLLK